MARVLVVEDSPTQGCEILMLLEDAGHGAELARDGVEALAMLDESRFDLVVTDLQMPRMDGLELVEALTCRHPRTPSVLVTAHGSEDLAAAALRRGAASYVPKRNLAHDLVPTLAGILTLSGTDPDAGRVQGCLERTDLRFLLPNDSAMVPPLVRRLEALVGSMGWCDESSLLRLSVALRESLMNAIDHGNLELDSELRQEDERVYRRMGEERRGQPPYRDRRVLLEARVTRSEATFVVKDEGPGFDPGSLPDPTDPMNLERIGGRGLLLIRTFMDEVRHNATGNEVTLVKRAEARAASPSTSRVPEMASC